MSVFETNGSSPPHLPPRLLLVLLYKAVSVCSLLHFFQNGVCAEVFGLGISGLGPAGWSVLSASAGDF